MSRRWIGVGGRYTIDWGGRPWTLAVDSDRPGLTSDGFGPMLALEGVSTPAKGLSDVLSRASLVRHESYLDRVEAVYAPVGWDTLSVRASWIAPIREVIDLEVQIQAASVDRLKGVEVHITSQCATAPGTSSASRWTVIEAAGGKASTYLEFVHPDDQSGTGSVPRSGWLRHSLFGHDLEKGVVLRGRIRGIWLDRAADDAEAARLFDNFLRQPPPLGP